jgi:Family of unknown function (DUF6502)
MTRLLVSKSPAKRRQRGKARSNSSLDGQALEAIECFARILSRCGIEPENIVAAVREACERVPAAWVEKGGAADPEIADAAHVLTMWFTDPVYLDSNGTPKWLPRSGSNHSLHRLIEKVDDRLDSREVVAYLIRTGAVVRKGARYQPRARALLLRGVRGPDHFRTLRVLLNMLRTLEHNVRPKKKVRGLFEYFAENPQFPAGSRQAFDRRLDRLGKEFLLQVDADMHRRARRRRTGDPTVRIGVGVYRFEEDDDLNANGLPETRRRSKKIL